MPRPAPLTIEGYAERHDFLTADEEAELGRAIALGESGSKQPLSPEASALASAPENVALARNLARKASGMNSNLIDPSESAAMLGLCEAARSFDPTRGISFATFARWRIVGAIGDAIRAWRPGGRNPIGVSVRSIHEPSRMENSKGNPGATLAEVLPSGDDPVPASLEAFDAFEALIRPLPGKHRRVMRLLYLDCSAGSMASAGRDMGYSESRISQLHSQAILYLKTGRFDDPGEPRKFMAASPKTQTRLQPRPKDELIMSLAMEPRLTPCDDVLRKKSQYRGLAWNVKKQRWIVQVWTGHALKYGGSFESEVEAARAYDALAREHLGDRARPNFPDESPAAVASPAPPVIATKRPRPNGLPGVGETWLHRDGEEALDCTVRVAEVRLDGKYQVRVLDGAYVGKEWTVTAKDLVRSGGEPAEIPKVDPAPEMVAPLEVKPVAVAVVEAPPKVEEQPTLAEPAVVATPEPVVVAAKEVESPVIVPPIDPEFAAIACVSAALAGLGKPACRRVLAYALDRFAGEAH